MLKFRKIDIKFVIRKVHLVEIKVHIVEFTTMNVQTSRAFLAITSKQGSPMDRPPGGSRGVTLGGGLAGQRMTLHRKNSIFYDL